MIKFKTTKEESALIDRIVKRARRESPDQFMGGRDELDLNMDITACHLNGCPLDLQKLLDAPRGPFGHDVGGIRRYLDRTTGKLTGFFDPRCSLPKAPKPKREKKARTIGELSAGYGMLQFSSHPNFKKGK
jgi:hypothetical protein